MSGFNRYPFKFYGRNTKKNACVVLFDYKTKPQFFETSKKWLLNVFASKHFSGSKDSCKVLLLNTESPNTSYSNVGKCFHASEVGIFKYDPKMLEAVFDQDLKTTQSDWLMGLATAIETIAENYHSKSYIMTLQLLFITDFSTPVEVNEGRIDYIINRINHMGIHLYIFGPEVKIPYIISTREDIQCWSKNIQFTSNEGENPNLSIAKRIIQNTTGVICDLELGQHLFECYNERWSSRLWKVPLTIGTSLSMPTSAVRFIKAITAPSLIPEMVGGKKDHSWHPVNNSLVKINETNVIGGVFRYNKFVPLPKDIENDFKYNGPRGFKIVGFTNLHNVPEMYMWGDGSHYVDCGNSKILRLLVEILHKQNKYAVARRIYYKNCRPKLMALLPNPKYGIFIMMDLPYAQNVNCEYAEEDISKAPKLENDIPVADAVYEYLQKLDVTDANNMDSHGNVKTPLAPCLMNSIQLSGIHQQCLKKYLDEESAIEKINLTFPKFVEEEAQYKQDVPFHPKIEVKTEPNDD